MPLSLRGFSASFCVLQTLLFSFLIYSFALKQSETHVGRVEIIRGAATGKLSMVKFPDQMEYHKNNLLRPKVKGVADAPSTNALLEEDFIERYSEQVFGVPARDFMKLVPASQHESRKALLNEKIDPVTGLRRSYYEQYLHGRKVFGSRVTVTIGRHSGVISALGHTLHHSKAPPLPFRKHYDTEKSSSHDSRVAQASITSDEALNFLRKHISARYISADTYSMFLKGTNEKDDPLSLKVFGEPELVWHRSGATQGRTGVVKLTYHFEGSVSIPESEVELAKSSKQKKKLHPFEKNGHAALDNRNTLIFDAFVDADSGSMFHFIDKTSRGRSPKRTFDSDSVKDAFVDTDLEISMFHFIDQLPTRRKAKPLRETSSKSSFRETEASLSSSTVPTTVPSTVPSAVPSTVPSTLLLQEPTSLPSVIPTLSSVPSTIPSTIPSSSSGFPFDDQYFYDYYYNSSLPSNNYYYYADDVTCNVTHGSCFDQNIRVFDGHPNEDPVLIFDDKNNRMNFYPTGDNEVDTAIAVTLQTNNLYRSITGGEWQTFAKEDRDLLIYLRIDMQNAYYDGNGIVFGTGFVDDDVVAHEWSHGYTDYTSSLVYEFQSGAINEAMSDIFGESVDQLNTGEDLGNGNGNEPMDVDSDTESSTLRTENPTQCTNHDWPEAVLSGTDDSQRWLVGEGVYYKMKDGSYMGALRDMYYGECFGDPSTTNSSSYYCGFEDNGGVHTNSGIINRLYAVLVDGGVNPDGSEIGKIGITKAVNLMWQMQLEMSPFTQFEDFGNTLNMVCQNNIGTFFFKPDVVNGSSVRDTEPLTEEDCLNVATAVDSSGVLVSTSEFCSAGGPIDPVDGAALCALADMFPDQIPHTCTENVPDDDPCLNLGAWGMAFMCYDLDPSNSMNEFTNVVGVFLGGLMLNVESGAYPSTDGYYNDYYSYYKTIDESNLLGNEFPPPLLELKHLMALDLSANYFQGTLPKDLFLKLQDASTLMLPNNAFTGLFPDIPSDGCSLSSLNLGGNQLNGALPENLFACTDMEELTLTRNKLSGPLPGLPGSIQILQLDKNEFTGHLPELNFTSLKTLSLSSNRFNGPITIPRSDLTYLDLSDNAFDGTLPDLLANLSLVEYIDLSTNKLSGDLKSLSSPTLQYLDIALNSFSGVLPAVESPSLYYLKVSGNSFEGDVSSVSFDSSSLSYLFLDKNSFAGDLSFISNFPYLQMLFAGANNFDGTIPDSLRKLSYVTGLDLSGNRLTGSIPEFISELKQLHGISLASNRFAGPVPFLGALTNLNYFDVKNNSLTGSLPASIGGLRMLSYFDVSSNKFSGTIPRSFGDSSGLNVIDISDNLLAGTIIKTFCKLPDLTYLNTVGNDFVCFVNCIDDIPTLDPDTVFDVPECPTPVPSSVPSSSSPSSVPSSSSPSSVPSSSSPSSSAPSSSSPSSSAPSSSSPSSSAPTISPPPPGTRIQVQYDVLQEISGISKEEYYRDEKNNDLIFRTTAATGAGLSDPNSVTIEKVDDANVVSMSMSFHLAESKKIKMSYGVKFVLGEGNTFTDPAQSTSALSGFISSGTFTKSLQSNAQAIAPSSSFTDAVSSLNVTISEPTVTKISSSSDSGSDGGISDGEIAAAVVVPFVFLIALAAGAYYYRTKVLRYDPPNINDSAANPAHDAL